ncbi:hypothetical protein MASR1M8_03860 [Thermomonas brevis]
MKVATLAVLGGLCFAGNALAADPAPQQDTPATAGSSLKVGIDAKTGKRRVLTAEESAALDAQAAPRTTMARARMAAPSLQAPPATYAESAAAGISKGGLTAYVAPLESLSHVTISRDANGKIVISEDGVPLGETQVREVASE